MTPLLGADGETYAVAQGNLVVGGLGVEGGDGSSLTVNIPTVGRIPRGATIEKMVDNPFINSSNVILNLHQGDFSTALSVSEAINDIFGDNVESILGHARYFSFYIFCGIGAALGQFFIEPTSTTPMVGASGAIAGVLGAYMIKFPKAKVHVFAVIIIFITTFIVPAQIVLGIWFIMQLSGGLNSLGINTTGGVAWFAHIGGFLVGVGSLKIFQTFHFKHNE